MFVRSGLLAGFFGLLLAGLLCRGCMLMGELRHPLDDIRTANSFRAVGGDLAAHPGLGRGEHTLVGTAAGRGHRARAGRGSLAQPINNRVNQVPDVALNFDPCRVRGRDDRRKAARRPPCIAEADELLVGYPGRMETTATVVG